MDHWYKGLLKMPSNTPADSQMVIAALQAERSPEHSQTRGFESRNHVRMSKSADGHSLRAYISTHTLPRALKIVHVTSRGCPNGEFHWYNSILTRPE